jgi:hypothetical protein
MTFERKEMAASYQCHVNICMVGDNIIKLDLLVDYLNNPILGCVLN